MQMSARVITGIASFCIAMTGIFLGNIFQFMMIGEINGKKLDGNLISYFGYTFHKIVRVFREYRHLYPNGRLRLYAFSAIALAFFGMFSAAVAFGIL